MRAGDVFLGGNYAELLASGEEDLPEEARSGPYALGQIIMVARQSMADNYVLPTVPEWFPARVCLPPPIEGQWYRWYDPFIWFETEGPIHIDHEDTPSNMAYVGKLWWQPKEEHSWYDARSFWAYPIDIWKQLFETKARGDSEVRA